MGCSEHEIIYVNNSSPGPLIGNQVSSIIRYTYNALPVLNRVDPDPIPKPGSS